MHKDDGGTLLAMAMVVGVPAAIEAQEAAGADEMVHSDLLPVALDAGDDEDGREWDARTVLEQVGVRFLGPVPDDDLFQRVILPNGWTRKDTGHSMHTTIVDGKGNERILVFYKAAFYDRRASGTVVRRFLIVTNHRAALDEGKIVLAVHDRTVASKEDSCGAVVFQPPALVWPHYAQSKSRTTVRSEDQRRADCRLDDARTSDMRGQCEAWLNARYPDWRNPAVYWD